MATMAMSPAEKLPGLPGSAQKPWSPGGLDAPRQLTSQEKRTFKDKLQSAILEAEEAELAAIREAAMQDKKSLSIAMLVEGRPQAFVDFFQLTHSTLLHEQPTAGAAATAAKPAAPAGKQGSPAKTGVTAAAPPGAMDLPQESLLLLKTQLVKADSARRAGQVEEVYGAYKHLAKYFAQLARLRTAEFFFKQCLYVSREAAWLPGELEANLALGVVYEELKDTAAAIACHERRLELASENGLQAEMETAYNSLTTVYLGQAEGHEREQRPAEAIEAYNRCLKAADRAGDMDTAARANYRMGMLSHEQGKWQDAMFYLRRFIDLCNSGAVSSVGKAAEGVANTTYAQCLQETGDVPGAIRCLEAYLDKAARGPEQSGPALASCNLGILYYNEGQYERAVAFFERFFEVARTLPDRRAVDAARVNLGVARGAVRMKAYMNMVNTDLPQLIAWKNGRVPFTS